MTTPHKVILIAIGLLVLINLGFSIFGRSNLNAIKNDITMSQENINAALKNIKDTQATLDSIKNSIANFSQYVKTVQTNVDVLTEKKGISDKKNAADLNALKNKVANIKVTFVKLDSLPAIAIKPL